ncbi:MAG: type II toxin-antitoxin system RelE/ParE family toxin [Desulfuromonadales bacterium]|nr:type II toxin-antitoxin system RelE/ParE family toxin [Desulfuromonadales bacterium]
MNKVVISPRAKADLSEIWDYTCRQWDVEQAEKYLRQLWAVIQQLPSNPAKSINIDDVRKGYQKALAGSHVIFFKATTHSDVQVVRVLHKRRDFERLL